MNIHQDQIIELLTSNKFLTSDTLLELLIIPITNENRLCLSSILQKNKDIQLSYLQRPGYVVRTYALKKVIGKHTEHPIC